MAIAYFSTWTTYGTWLPGDERGWFDAGKGFRPPDLMRQLTAALRMSEAAIALDSAQRRFVEDIIASHCAIRGWTLHAVNCRSNHVHVVVSAIGRAIEVPREQFKAWSTRKLKEVGSSLALRANALRANGEISAPVRDKWWSERGWDLYIDTQESLHDCMAYVLEGQDCDR